MSHAVAALVRVANRASAGARRRLATTFCLIFAVGALAACGGDEPDQAGTAQGGTLTVAVADLGSMQWSPTRSGEETEKVAVGLYDNLIKLDPETRTLKPLLAESYSVSEDGRTWTFKLRPNIKFHGDNGTVTAEDVKYSWEMWMAEGANHNTTPVLSDAVGGDMKNFEIVSDLEFKINSPSPVLGLANSLSDSDTGLQITSKSYHEKGGAEADKHPIGTGPWEYVSSTPGEELVLKANKTHWDRPPAFDRLVMKEIPDGAARLVQVQSGAVDIASLDAPLISESKAAGLKLETIKDIANAFVILGGTYPGHDKYDRASPWIQADSPTRGAAIREAMSLAIDRKLIVDKVLYGEAQLAYGPLIQYNAVKELTDPSWTLPEYNLDKAKQKLAEGGYPNGFKIQLLLYPDDVDTVAIGQAIAGMWKDLGLDVEQKIIDEGVLDEMLNQTATDGVAWVKIAGFRPEPAATLNSYRSKLPDDHKFFNPGIDQAYDAMSSEVDYETRLKIAHDLIQKLRDENPVMTLFTVNMPFVVGPKVSSWTPRPGMNYINNLESAKP
jgi:peptide/nickel transport system substrate-binding protein